RPDFHGGLGRQRAPRDRQRTPEGPRTVYRIELHGNGFARQLIYWRYERRSHHHDACAEEITEISNMRSCVATLILIAGLSQPAAAQTASSSIKKLASKSWVPPRTVDGQPDLQGIWAMATLTPLERPADLAGKAFLTEQEAAEYEQRTLTRVNTDRRDDDGD